MIKHDTTIVNFNVVLDEEVKKAIIKNIGPLEVITAQNISILTDNEIDQFNCSTSIKTQLKKFRNYTKIFLENTDALSQIRREMLCPITLDYPNKVVLSPCCGHIFDKSALYQYLKEMGNLSGGKCPLCHQFIRTSILLELVGDASLRQIIEQCR